MAHAVQDRFRTVLHAIILTLVATLAIRVSTFIIWETALHNAHRIYLAAIVAVQQITAILVK